MGIQDTCALPPFRCPKYHCTAVWERTKEFKALTSSQYHRKAKHQHRRPPTRWADQLKLRYMPATVSPWICKLLARTSDVDKKTTKPNPVPNATNVNNAMLYNGRRKTNEGYWMTTRTASRMASAATEIDFRT